MKRGWPIRLYLAGLAALSVAAAFLVALAVVTLLPPRPTDTWRLDQLSAVLEHAYAQAKAGEKPSPQPRVQLRITPKPPTLRARGFSALLLTRRLAQTLQADPNGVRIGLRPSGRQQRLILRLPLEPSPPRPPPPDFETFLEPTPGAAASASLEREAQRLLGERQRIWSVINRTPSSVVLAADILVAVRLPDGRWLEMSRGRNWALINWIGRAALALGATSAALAVIAALFARRLAAPIGEFAQAVQAVGVDPQRQPVAERGPREVRDAARAVNAMQARLRALIADRTRTLAAVAHDFRTPLMRLRLGLERLAAPQRDALSKEIDELEALVSSFIAFAREDPAEESRVRLDIAALVDSQVQDRAAEGAAVRYQGLQRLVVMGQRLALKRLVANLLDNALKYGAHAVLRLSAQGGFAVIEFEDDGPGVPAAERERIFEPFVRLNHTGSAGAGLGLAAARSIARAHGGDVVALAAPGGGGLFRVTLPLSV